MADEKNPFNFGLGNRTVGQGIGDFLLGFAGQGDLALKYQQQRAQTQQTGTLGQLYQEALASGQDPARFIMNDPRTLEIMGSPGGMEQIAQLKEMISAPEVDPNVAKLQAAGLVPGSPEARAALFPEGQDPTSIREMQAMGFDPKTPEGRESYAAFKQSQSRPNAGSTVNVNMPAPMKDNIWTEHGMKRIGELDTELSQSQRVMVDLDAAEAAIDAGAHQEVAGPKIGFQTPLGHFGVDLGTDFLVSMMQVGRALGIVDADRMAETELLDSITSRMAPMMRPVGSGSSSDRDMELFLKAVPGLSKSAAGNKKIIQLMRKGVLHKQEQMKLMVEMLEDGTYDPSEFSERVGKLGRPFSKDEMETLRIVAQNRPVQLQPVRHLGSGKTTVAPKEITPAAIEKMQQREILMLDVTKLNAAQRAAMVNRMSALGM